MAFPIIVFERDDMNSKNGWNIVKRWEEHIQRRFVTYCSSVWPVFAIVLRTKSGPSILPLRDSK